MMMEQVDQVDLCLICCSKVKSYSNNLDSNNSQLLSGNLIIFYLCRKVLQLNDNELKKNLISCGNPVEWIRLCDKCTELTRQAEELYRKLKEIERRLNCVQQLIWDKTTSSINCEHDRKLVEQTIDLKKTSGQIWRRIRNHVANKCNSTKSNGAAGGAAANFSNPFSDGDKLANYLITQKAPTAILPNEQNSERNENEEDDHDNILEQTIEEDPPSLSSPPPSPVKIKIEVTPQPQLDRPLQVEPHFSGDTPDQCQNYENLLIDKLLEDLEDVKVEFDERDDKKEESLKKVDANLEEILEVSEKEDGDDTLVDHKNLNYDKVDEEAMDSNWEPDEVTELADDEESEKKIPEKGTSSQRASAPKRRRDKVTTKVPPSFQKRRSSSKYIKKGRKCTVLITEDGRFKCRLCDLTFARRVGLNGHERTKHSKFPPGAFPCGLCGRTFNARDYLRKHQKYHHKLDEDGKPIVKPPKLKLVQTEDGKYQCRHCDQSFATKSGCSIHENEKHSKTPGAFVCDICGRAFNSSNYLRSHKSCSHKLKADGTPRPPKSPKLEKDQVCDLCGKGFQSPRHLKRHIQFVHEKRFNFKCTLCGMGCRCSDTLKKHQLAKHPEDPSVKKLIEEEDLHLWKCPVIGCSFRFIKEKGVKGHLKSKHGKSEEEVEGLELRKDAAEELVLRDPSLKQTCEMCGKIFGNKFGLRNHVKLVHENRGKAKDFICEICGGGFVSREYLGIHVRKVHLKKGVKRAKNFKCEICGKGYTHNYMLKAHMKIHEGRRDYFCDKCGHDFMSEQHLKNHKSRTNCGVEGKMARVYKRKGEENKII